jgi:zinc carboxypeptidase
MRHLTIICALVIAAGFPQTRSVSVADFFGDFEGASLVNPRQLGPNHFAVETQSVEKYGGQGRLGVWVCAGIRLNEATIKNGDVIRIVVPAGNKSAKLRAVFSYDRRNWQPVETQRAPFDFDVPLRPGRKAVYFATYYPYFHSQMIEHNHELAKSRYVKTSVVGKSVRGREIPLITVTDPKAPDSRKRRVFILSGTHGAETASIYGVEGMLDFLVSEGPMAQEMRRLAVWKIIPIHNVDAAVEGLDRRNAGGINLYFDWGYHEEAGAKLAANKALKDDPAISRRDFSQPETLAAYKAIMEFEPQVFLDVHSWHFAGDGYWGPDPAVKSQKADALKQSIAKYFKIKQWDHEAWEIASAPTIIRKLDIAATLPEFALCFDSDDRPKTPDSMRRQGTQILRGVYEYLNSLR